VTLTIEHAPTTITDQPVTVDISLSGASVGQNYLRVDFYKDGTTNYFGETSVGSNWYSGSDGSQYAPITIPDSASVVTANLQARIGTPSPNEFPGPGAYKLRIRRYTSSGNVGEVTQTPIDVQITYLSPTSTPTPTPIPKQTSTPTPTRIPTPTKTPTPTKIPTATPTSVNKTITPKPSSSVTSSKKESKMPSNYPTSVLGASDKDVSPTPDKDKKDLLVKGSSKQSFNTVTLILCSVGGIMLCICGILVYLKKRRGEL